MLTKQSWEYSVMNLRKPCKNPVFVAIYIFLFLLYCFQRKHSIGRVVSVKTSLLSSCGLCNSNINNGDLQGSTRKAHTQRVSWRYLLLYQSAINRFFFSFLFLEHTNKQQFNRSVKKWLLTTQTLHYACLTTLCKQNVQEWGHPFMYPAVVL